jgi:hypothetical protein
MRTARKLRAFLAQSPDVPNPRTGWLTWQDSNLRIPTANRPIEKSGEFARFWPKLESGDFFPRGCPQAA